MQGLKQVHIHHYAKLGGGSNSLYIKEFEVDWGSNLSVCNEHF